MTIDKAITVLNNFITKLPEELRDDSTLWECECADYALHVINDFIDELNDIVYNEELQDWECADLVRGLLSAEIISN